MEPAGGGNWVGCKEDTRNVEACVRLDIHLATAAVHPALILSPLD